MILGTDLTAGQDDIWTVPHAGGEREEVRPALIVETIKGVEPLDNQFGIEPKKAVPDALREVLFDQPKLTGAEIALAGGDTVQILPLHTYAILDAAKVICLPEMLEDSGLDHACLFQGEAAKELRDAAPWIVRLEECHRFTRYLFTQGDAPWNMWGVEPGIFLRSTGSINDMRRHLRKFIRVQNEKGKWLYWRFWEPKWIVDMLGELHPNQKEAFLSGIFRLIAVRAHGHLHIIS